jgi:UDP-N-acetylmuramate--alanine ligase
VIGYHATSASGYRATNLRIEKSLFHFDLETPQGPVQNLVMGVPGRFNLENAIAASAAALTAGVDHQSLRSALASYSGVVRRFDVRILRDDFAYIDDYAHHPEELKACITAVREIFPGKRITGMFQPHLFTRTRDLADEFARSLELLDELILLDIYPAREKPIEGITSRILLDRVNLATKVLLPWDDVLNTLENSRPEVLLTLGAGDIDRFTDPITELFTNTGKA